MCVPVCYQPDIFFAKPGAREDHDSVFLSSGLFFTLIAVTFHETIKP